VFNRTGHFRGSVELAPSGGSQGVQQDWILQEALRGSTGQTTSGDSGDSQQVQQVRPLQKAHWGSAGQITSLGSLGFSRTGHFRGSAEQVTSEGSLRVSSTDYFRRLAAVQQDRQLQ
jgi:hypothetical protein